MSIITKPATIEKNLAATVILNKSELAAIIPDIYYADSANWKEVFIYYKSSTGNQRKILKFNASQTLPEATFLASLKAGDIFQVRKIVVMDFDGGSILIPRADLVVADFDIDMTSMPSSLIYSRIFSSSFSGEQFNGSSIVGSNLVVNPNGRYAFSVPDLNNSTGAYTIKIHVTTNTLSGSGGQLLAGFNIYPVGGPSWSPYIQTSPESIISSQILSGNCTNGYISEGYFNLYLDTLGYTGSISISRIEIYKGYNQ